MTRAGARRASSAVTARAGSSSSAVISPGRRVDARPASTGETVRKSSSSRPSATSWPSTRGPPSVSTMLPPRARIAASRSAGGQRRPVAEVEYRASGREVSVQAPRSGRGGEDERACAYRGMPGGHVAAGGDDGKPRIGGVPAGSGEGRRNRPRRPGRRTRESTDDPVWPAGCRRR